MEKEIKYIAPWAEILSAQVERGYADSETGNGGSSYPGFDL